MGTIPASENIFPLVELAEGAAPATPASGQVTALCEGCRSLYSKDDAGAEYGLRRGGYGPCDAHCRHRGRHDASAISIADAGTLYTATDVEAALAGSHAAVGAGGISPTTVDAKGDLIAGTANDTVDNLTAGTNGTFLSADSAQTTGLAWASVIAAHTHAASGIGATGGGTTVSPVDLNVSERVLVSGHITSAVNADQNDYAPTGIHDASVLRFTSFSANRTITGIDAGTTGELLIIINTTSFSCLLPNESVSSAAANRFRSPNAATHTIRQGGGALLIYINGRWTVVAA